MGCCKEVVPKRCWLRSGGDGDGQLLWGGIKEEDSMEEAKSSDCRHHAGKIYFLFSVKHNVKASCLRRGGKCPGCTTAFLHS